MFITIEQMRLIALAAAQNLLKPLRKHILHILKEETPLWLWPLEDHTCPIIWSTDGPSSDHDPDPDPDPTLLKMYEFM
jgi:hypothetical protein